MSLVQTAKYDDIRQRGPTGVNGVHAGARPPNLDDDSRVVGVNPGPVDTDRIRMLLKQRAVDWYGDESRWQEPMKRYPLCRPAHVRGIVDPIVYLASDRAGYTTGTVITIDGGITARNSMV